MENRHAERIWGLDILRLLAAFAVVALHVNPQAHLDVAIPSPAWGVMNLCTVLCCWSVPSFFMISGAFLLSPSSRQHDTRYLYRRNILRMLTAFIFWSAFYAIAHCALYGKGKWTFLNQFFRGHYHMWYLFALISLYWITPLLRKITESKRTTEYFLLTGFVFTFLIGRVLNFVSLLNLPHADVLASLQSAYGQMNPYRTLLPLYDYVLGFYLFSYPLSKKARCLIYAAGLIGLLGTLGLTCWHSVSTGAVSSVFTSNASLGVLAMTSAIFVFFKDLRLHFGTRAQKRLIFASKCTFGVYLVHAFILERLNLSYPLSAFALACCILGASLAVYGISFAVSAALNRIPKLNQWIV